MCCFNLFCEQDTLKLSQTSTLPHVVRVQSYIATAEGKLHHCCVHHRNSKSSLASGLSYLPTSDAQQVLYIYETVELELAMTTPELPDFDDLDPDEVEPESFSCNIKILKG